MKVKTAVLKEKQSIAALALAGDRTLGMAKHKFAMKLTDQGLELEQGKIKVLIPIGNVEHVVFDEGK